VSELAGTKGPRELSGFPIRHPALLPLFATLSLLGSALGSTLRYPEVGAAVLFPPYAVLTAALVVTGRRLWPWLVGISVGTHVVMHWPHWSLSWVLAANLANVARALTAALLLRATLGTPPRLEGVPALVKFVLSAALAGPAVGATLGAANVVLHGASDTYWRPWSAWFVSNALTGLTMLPLLIEGFASLARPRTPLPATRRLLEALGLAVLLLATCQAAFLTSHAGGPWPSALLFYAPVPLLIWAALRFGPGGASLALATVAFAAVWGADRGTGPFLDEPRDESVITLQVFLVLTTVPVLCIAAVDQARHEGVDLYRALLASVDRHVALLDARGFVLEASDSWRRFASRESTRPIESAGPGDDYMAAIRRAAADGDPAAPAILEGLTRVLRGEERRFELEYDRDEGREAYALIIEPLARADGGAVVTRLDVTARRQAQLEVVRQQRELAHLSRVAMLGQISGALAHELNQPLTVILSNAEVGRRLLKRRPPDLAELDEILGEIAGEDRRAADVIQHLRSLLKHDEVRMRPLDPGELASEVLKLAHTELIMRRVSPRLSIEPGLPPVRGDRVQLQQVLLNLILNACEAMNANPPDDRELALSVGQDGDGHVRFVLRDRGAGIAEGMAERLFDAFATTKADGLGLGLSISRTIVITHGGRIWAENNPDGGATFRVAIPRAP
jgi:signal transduction histidine kinase/integral membrane sensor domain MASE1